MSAIQTVYMVKELSKTLLGLPPITALSLAVRVDAMKEDDNIQEKFAPVFRGLGNMGELRIPNQAETRPTTSCSLHVEECTIATTQKSPARAGKDGVYLCYLQGGQAYNLVRRNGCSTKDEWLHKNLC